MSVRTMQFRIYRYDPDKDEAPYMQDISVDIDPVIDRKLLDVLTKIKAKDDTLSYRRSCREGICGSCAMVINGRPGLACQTRTEHLPAHVTLHPLPVFKLIADLSVDTGSWFREMYQKTESWIHTRAEVDPTQQESRMPNDTAEAIYELERCIECGCCIAACGTARLRPDFMGAAALNRIARFRIDPRDERTDSDHFELIGTDAGVFGCMGLLACDSVCPKQLPLHDQLGIMRRMVSMESVRGILPDFLRKKMQGCGHSHCSGKD